VWAVTASRSIDRRPTGSTRVRFSFETMRLRQAVDVADKLRRDAANGVRVRPVMRSRMGGYRWEILVTTGPLDPGGIGAVEEEMRRVAWAVPGLRFTGGLCLSGQDGDATNVGHPEGGQDPVCVLVIDDSAPFRRAARQLLELRGFRVIGTAGSAASGFEAVARLRPDAVLLDVRLPDGSGLDLCELLTREEDPPAVLLVSSDGAADWTLAKARGARGSVAKVDLWKADLGDIWG
jgi:CheY-like chemotaxis protein